jgi:hypothetical protein
MGSVSTSVCMASTIAVDIAKTLTTSTVSDATSSLERFFSRLLFSGSEVLSAALHSFVDFALYEERLSSKAEMPVCSCDVAAL